MVDRRFPFPLLPDDLDPAALADGDVPVYDTTTGRWVPQAITPAAGLVVLAVDADGVFYPVQPGAGTHVLEQDADGTFYAVAAA